MAPIKWTRSVGGCVKRAVGARCMGERYQYAWGASCLPLRLCARRLSSEMGTVEGCMTRPTLAMVARWVFSCMNAEKYRKTFIGRPEGAALRLVSGPVRPEVRGPMVAPLVRASTRPMRVLPEVAHDPSVLVMPHITERRNVFESMPVKKADVGMGAHGTAQDALAQILGAWNMAHGF